MQNYYEIIGVSVNCDETTIKNAYLQKIKFYHPDVYEGDKLFALEMTAKLNEAYNTLKDEETRKIYNRTLKLNTNKQTIKSNKSQIKKENKLVGFFKRVVCSIKNLFKRVVNGIKNTFKNSFSVCETDEQKERKRLNTIILIQTLLIALLIILIIVT